MDSRIDHLLTDISNDAHFLDSLNNDPASPIPDFDSDKNLTIDYVLVFESDENKRKKDKDSIVRLREASNIQRANKTCYNRINAN